MIALMYNRDTTPEEKAMIKAYDDRYETVECARRLFHDAAGRLSAEKAVELAISFPTVVERMLPPIVDPWLAIHARFDAEDARSDLRRAEKRKAKAKKKVVALRAKVATSKEGQ